MAEDRYARVDGYLDELFGTDPVIAAARRRSLDAGLPDIAVSPATGRLLQVLAMTSNARSILEIGTLGGESTIWLARGLVEDGRLISLERSPEHAEVARRNLEAAGLADRVEIRVGDARQTLAALRDEGAGPFDLIFIDADKAPYAAYLEAAVTVARPGALIVADNVIRRGAVADGHSDDEAVTGVQAFNASIASDPRLSAAILQTVGSKGHDGLAFAVVTDATG
jgi:caffeoyl-CoA O-methyltransferase